MSLTTKVYAQICPTELIAALDNVQTTIALANPLQLDSGTGSNQADVVYSSQRTIAASGNETLDLNALTDSAGRTRNFAKVKAILITASSANTNNVIIGNAAAATFTGGFMSATQRWAVPPGGHFLATAPVAGWASTDGASDSLMIANSGSGTSVTYNIVIVGTSA